LLGFAPTLAVLLVDITVPLLPMIILLYVLLYIYDLDCDSSIAIINARSLCVAIVIITIGPTNDLL
jgi:hypothetical protein